MSSGSEDRISELPDPILHHILSLLPTKTSAKTSVLSKKWNYIWDSYPVFEFLEKELTSTDPQNSERFTAIVDHKLTKFCQHKFRIEKFILSITLHPHQPNLEPQIHRWISLLIEKHVRHLDLTLIQGLGRLHYSYFPRAIFSAETLTVLKISGQNLVWPSDIRLHSLVLMSMTLVDIEGILIFDDFKFPCIESISLNLCSIPGGLKISCKKLKKLLVDFCGNLNYIEISAPNLVCYSFCLNRLVPSVFSFSAATKPTTFQFCFYSANDDLHTPWFIKLKEFLLKQNSTTQVALSINTRGRIWNTFDRNEASRRCYLLPHELNVLYVQVHTALLDYEAFMDGILWSCHPKILCILLTESTCPEFFKFVCEKLLSEENNEYCCSSSCVKCWRHSVKVKYVTIEDNKGIIEEKVPLSADTFLRIKLDLPWQIVEFYFTW